MYIYEENRCACTCQNRPGPLPLEVQAQFRLDAMVNFDLRGASLSEVGSLLADLVDADLYVPAHRLEESQEFFLEAVPLQTVISALGMLRYREARPGRPPVNPWPDRQARRTLRIPGAAGTAP